MASNDPPDPELYQTRSFEEARRVHRHIEENPDEYPEGWVEQVRFRDRYDLPPFRPPQFLDDTRIHDTVTALENELNISIDFVSTGENRTWNVRIDDITAFSVKRSRNDAANTTVEMISDEFAERIYEECE